MIIGIGIDIIEIKRMKQAIGRMAFCQRVFTAAEREYCDGRGAQCAASYAARFAGKEAVSKALGTGFVNGCWHDIEIIADERGCPQVNLHGWFAEKAMALKVSETHISLTHSRDYAAAQVVLSGRDEP